jgi:aminopeptidase YwaD
LYGRGYVKNGDRLAAEYIRHECKKAGIKPMTDHYFQSFRINVNTFPGVMKMEINGIALIPDQDYLIDPASPGVTGSFIPVSISASDVLNGKAESALDAARGKVVLADARELKSDNLEIKRTWNEWIKKMIFNNPYALSVLIEITGDKLTFGTSSQLSAIPFIILSGKACPDSVSVIRINIMNCYVTGYDTQNICGYIPGIACPDSFLVFTAHYDHLGRMGKETFFPGANDNASGVAMLLDLARYFASNPQRYSVVFIFFSGEELGLLGSSYFADYPLIQLQAVKFLINLDLVGTGEEGITVVNASAFPDEFTILTGINEYRRLVSDIKKRGVACNSDHCPFFSKGVPCFFIYTRGGIAAYHDLNDRPETLPLTAFQGLSKLLIQFAGTF